MTAMNERGQKSGSGAVIFCGLMFLFVMVLYVLSFGPALWLHWRGYLPANLLVVYTPLGWGGEICEPFGNVLTWYKNLFREPVQIQ